MWICSTTLDTFPLQPISCGVLGLLGNIKPLIRTNNMVSVGQTVKKQDEESTKRPRRCRVHTSFTAYMDTAT